MAAYRLLLKKIWTEAEISAVDISGDALSLALENAEVNDVEINFFLDDILKYNESKYLDEYDIIVSNPPYVLESEKTVLHKNVIENEPHEALFVDDTDALIFYKTITLFAIRKTEKRRPAIL